MTSPDMIADFKACGGFLMLATGFRMVKFEKFSNCGYDSCNDFGYAIELFLGHLYYGFGLI